MPKLLCVLIHLTFTTPFDFLELFIYNENKEAKKPKSVDIAKVKLLRGASFFMVILDIFTATAYLQIILFYRAF